MLAYSVLFSFIIGGVISGVPDFRLSIRWNKYKQELEQGLYICPWSEGDIGYCTIEDGIDGTHNSALAFCASKRDAVECDAHPSCKWEGGEPPEYCNSFTRTKCFSKAVNVWSDWAYFPVRWKGETHYHTITVGMDKVGCSDEMVLDGADTDFRVCIQVASETQEGEVSCSEWSSNGRQGGTGELADTLQGDPVSRVRITIEVRPMVDATPINDFRIGLFDDNMVVYRDWVTAFFVEKDKDRVLTKREFGVYNEYDNIGWPFGIYMEVKNDDDYCCSLADGKKPKYRQFCKTGEHDKKGTQKYLCEMDRAWWPKGKRDALCAWRKCDIVDSGYCTVIDGFIIFRDGASQKAFCAGEMDRKSCMAEPICKWEAGEPPLAYQFDEGYNSDIDPAWTPDWVKENDEDEDEEFEFAVVGNPLASSSIGDFNPHAVRLSLVVACVLLSAICLTGLYAFMVRGKKAESDATYDEYMQTI